MFATYLIGLREGLEASLVVGILVAYLVRIGRRDQLRTVWAGVATAVVASLGFGAFLTFGPRGLSDRAQEIIAGTLSFLAVALITWMIFWMGRVARHLRSDLESQLDAAISAGSTSVFVIALLAVGREGLETALFLWSGAQTSGTGAGAGPLIGAALGLATSVALGFAIYRGALRVNLRTFFAWTGAFLILIAAGVLMYGIHEFQEAGVLPGEESLVFDVSATIAPASWYGTLLKGVFGFSPTTTWLQAVAWLTYTIPTLVLFRRTLGARPSHRPQPQPVPQPQPSRAA